MMSGTQAFASKAENATAWGQSMIPIISEPNVMPGERKLFCETIRSVMSTLGNVGLLSDELSPSVEDSVLPDDLSFYPEVVLNKEKTNESQVARRQDLRLGFVAGNAKKKKLRANLLAVAHT